MPSVPFEIISIVSSFVGSSSPPPSPVSNPDAPPPSPVIVYPVSNPDAPPPSPVSFSPVSNPDAPPPSPVSFSPVSNPDAPPPPSLIVYPVSNPAPPPSPVCATTSSAAISSNESITCLTDAGNDECKLPDVVVFCNVGVPLVVSAVELPS